jgi:DNA-binding MarR family transcriptional regulator
MDANPSEAAIQAWARLVRVSGSLLDAVEAELKAAGFPPLAWYDALLELDRVPDGRLRPFELERHMLLPQYSTSRLVARLEKAGFVERLGCPNDRRGQHVSITAAGRQMRARMWPAYASAIQRHLGSKIDCADAQKLAELLGQLSAWGCEGALCASAEAEPQLTR